VATILGAKMFPMVCPVFTGLDLIVVFLAVALIFYVTSADGGGSEFKPEPLTVMVVVIVVGMIVISFT
jgi:hypothetical protein